MQSKDLPLDRIVREPERERITGVPTSTWYVLQDSGLAPRPVPLGVKAVGWLYSELQAYIATAKAKRDTRLQSKHSLPARHRRERKTAPCP